MPEWARKAFCKGYAEIFAARARSWDDVFGAPYKKGTNLSAVRRRKALEYKAWYCVRSYMPLANRWMTICGPRWRKNLVSDGATATPDGFVVHCFAPGDDPIKAKDYVREKLGLPAFNGSRRRASTEDVERLLQQAVAQRGTQSKINIIKTYDYCASDGAVLYQVCRLQPKRFGNAGRTATADGSGSWKTGASFIVCLNCQNFQTALFLFAKVRKTRTVLLN